MEDKWGTQSSTKVSRLLIRTFELSEEILKKSIEIESKKIKALESIILQKIKERETEK